VLLVKKKKKKRVVKERDTEERMSWWKGQQQQQQSRAMDPQVQEVLINAQINAALYNQLRFILSTLIFNRSTFFMEISVVLNINGIP